MSRKNKANYCTFYIVRHGETEWNVKGIMQGQKDSPLTKVGFNQAKQIAAVFKKVKFAKIFSSDLLRAKRTAEIIAIEKKATIKTSKLLRERRLGNFEGKRPRELRKELKEQFEKREKLAKEDRFKFKLDNGIESDEEIVSRFITFLRKAALAYPNEKILIITHGGIMCAFLIHLGWAKYEEFSSGLIGNTSYIVIESDGVDFFIKEVFGIEKQIKNF